MKINIDGRGPKIENINDSKDITRIPKSQNKQKVTKRSKAKRLIRAVTWRIGYNDDIKTSLLVGYHFQSWKRL